MPNTPCLHAANNIGDLGIIGSEQVALADQRVFDLTGEFEPLLTRACAEIAERADRLLARSFQGVDRFHQHVIGVRPALVGANRFADVHVTLCITNHPTDKEQIISF